MLRRGGRLVRMASRPSKSPAYVAQNCFSSSHSPWLSILTKSLTANPGVSHATGGWPEKWSLF